MEHSIKVSYGTDVCKVIFDNLDIRTKTVGIGISDFYGTESTYEFLHTLCTQRHDLKVVLIPGDQDNPNLILLPEDVLGIYLYQGTMSEVVKGYDVWVTIGSDEVTFNNNLPDTTVSGDKFVVANQMKNVLSQVDINKVSDQPVDMLFSLKSMALRTPVDWWIEFPEFTDEKRMAVNILKYVQDNEKMFTDIISIIKDRITNNTFGVGIILEFSKYNNVMATMISGPRGNFVRIKVGMNYFFFSVERAITFDWYKLMVDQLDILAGG